MPQKGERVCRAGAGRCGPGKCRGQMSLIWASYSVGQQYWRQMDREVVFEMGDCYCLYLVFGFSWKTEPWTALKGIFVGVMAAYLLYLGLCRGAGMDPEEASEEEEGEHPVSKDLLKVLVGILMVTGGKLLVTCAVDLATAAGMSQWLISVTIVAAGTSAPEMVTTLLLCAVAIREWPLVGSSDRYFQYAVGVGCCGFGDAFGGYLSLSRFRGDHGRHSVGH